jgi:type IV secretion system protein VirB6
MLGLVVLTAASAPAMAQLALPSSASSIVSAATSAATGTTTTTNNPQNCTNFKDSMRVWFPESTGGVTSPTAPPSGLLSEIYIFIKDVVNDATEKLFRAFTSNAAYQNAVYWAMVLMVVFFGVAFTIGIIQVSFAQVLIRLIKLGIVMAVVSSAGWTFFSDYAVKFFMDGTDELVTKIMAIGTGATTIPAGATPFYQLDRLAGFLIQPDTLVAIMGSTFAGGPYGMAMGGLMAMAMWGFVMLVIKCLRTYAVTFVGRSLLLGIAPVFIVFLLFERTKQLFSSWLNALLSMSLQPILLFTFLSFFMVLIESAGKDMLKADLCWTEYNSVQGTDNKLAFWRFKDPKTEQLMTSQMTWEGSLSCLMTGKGKDGGTCPEFPLSIVDILCFLILVYIAQRFAEVIDRIANDLSNTFITLDAGGKVDQFISQQSSNVMKSFTPGKK